MKVTRVDPLVGPLVEVELVALRQMEAALRGFVNQDLDASTMRTVAEQLVEGPLLRDAAQFDPSGEQGEEAAEEDWPSEITLSRESPLHQAGLHTRRAIESFDYETRRYVPATDTSKEERERAGRDAEEKVRRVSEPRAGCTCGYYLADHPKQGPDCRPVSKEVGGDGE